MIVNDLQRLRWQILDECLRDTSVEYFMGGARNKETETIKCLLTQVNRKLRAIKREYKCSKRQLQLDIELFEKKGLRMEPRFRRGHKRILRYINLQCKNPLLRQPVSTQGASTLSLSALTNVLGPDTLALRLQGRAADEIGKKEIILNTTLDESARQVILSYGTDIEVVEPRTLRDEMLANGLAIVRLYSQKAVAIERDEEVVAPASKPIEEPKEELKQEMKEEIVVEPVAEEVEPGPLFQSSSLEEPGPVEEEVKSSEPDLFSIAQPEPMPETPKQEEKKVAKPESEKKPEAKHQAGEQLSMFDDLFG